MGATTTGSPRSWPSAPCFNEYFVRVSICLSEEFEGLLVDQLDQLSRRLCFYRQFDSRRHNAEEHQTNRYKREKLFYLCFHDIPPLKIQAFPVNLYFTKQRNINQQKNGLFCNDIIYVGSYCVIHKLNLYYSIYKYLYNFGKEKETAKIFFAVSLDV